MPVRLRHWHRLAEFPCHAKIRFQDTLLIRDQASCKRASALGVLRCSEYPDQRFEGFDHRNLIVVPPISDPKPKPVVELFRSDLAKV